MTERLPLEGLKVVDISQGIAGPHCGMLLALYGADVVKIEPPSGDWMRRIGQRYGAQTAHSAAFNRGKRSVAIDLKRPAALEVAKRMIKQADVFVENSRPGAVTRLGLGYEQVCDANPGLVYCSITGFGQEGPYRDRPGTDTVIQAYSGMMSLNRATNGEPVKLSTFLIDALTGLYAFQAVSMALYERRDSGLGKFIDVSLMQSMAAVLAPNIMEQYLLGGPPRLPNVPGGVYQTQDGWVLVTLLREDEYESICRILGAPELADDPRFDDFEKRAANKDTLLPMLRDAFLKGTTAEWAEKMQAADLLCSPVLTPLDWLADPHVQAVQAAPLVTQPDVGAVPVPHVPGAPPSRDDDPRQRLPGVGEHTRAVLEEMGLDEAEIADLLAGKDAAA